MKRQVIPLIIVCTVAALYAQSIAFPWTQLDDPKHVFENPAMLQPSLAGLWSFWKAPYFGMYIPSVYSIWMGISTFTHATWAFHFVNVVFHTANACLVFLILSRLNLSAIAALFGALFFAVHPTQVESVAWISGLKDVSFGFFSLLTIYWFLGERKRASLIAFALALLCKPTAVVLPVALFLLSFNVKRILPFALLSLPFLILTKVLQPDSQVQILVSIPKRFVVALDSLGFYIAQALVPLTYALDYGRSPDKVIWNSTLLFHLALVAGFLASVWYLFKRNRLAAIGLLLFGALMLPTLGIIPFQFQLFSTVCDRYLYLPMFGLTLTLAVFIEKVPLRSQGIVATLVVALLAARTYPQVRVWSSDEALFKHALRHNPDSFLSHNNWAFALYHSGRPFEAAAHFRQTVRLRPNTAGIHMNYAASLMKIGQIEEALREFEEVLRLEPNHSVAKEVLARHSRQEQAQIPKATRSN